MHRFWATRPGEPWTSDHVREFTLDDDTNDEILGLVYGADTPLVTRGPVDREAATSSHRSQPRAQGSGYQLAGH